MKGNATPCPKCGAPVREGRTTAGESVIVSMPGRTVMVPGDPHEPLSHLHPTRGFDVHHCSKRTPQ